MLNSTLRLWACCACPGFLVIGLASCGGGGSSSTSPITPPPGPTYTVGGTITGVAGSGMVLFKNGDEDFDNINVSAAGSFTFAVGVSNGTRYTVQVHSQPFSPTQNCVVRNGSGTINSANVTNVSVVCEGVGHFAYAANAGDNTLSVYSMDSTTGALTPVGTPVPTGASPYAIVGSPDRQRVYVCNENSNNISAYAINSTSGALTPIAGSPFAAGTDPQALAFDPSGAYLYIANNGSNSLSAYAVNAATGALTPLSTATYATGKGPSAVSIDGSGKFIAVANNGGSNDISVFTIMPETGELTPVPGSPFAAGGNPHSLVFGGYFGEYLYTANFKGTGSTISGFSVDPATGTLTALSGSPFDLAVDNYIATDRNGLFLYVTTGASVVAYSIGNGAPTALAGFPIAAGANAYSVTVDPSNQFIYVGNDGAANVSGYTLNFINFLDSGLTPLSGSPFPAGTSSDFLAIL